MSVVVDQTAVPLTNSGSAELLIQSTSVSGGTLYTTVLRQPGVQGQPIGVAQNFVPSSAGGSVRYLALSSAKSDLGEAITATAGTPTGTVGISRTAGTSLQLVGETTSGNAKTNKALFEFDLPDSYVAGSDIALKANCNYSGSGTVTAASTTMTVTAYTEVNGVEAALTVSAAQRIPSTATDLTFTITGTGLTPGAHVALELAMLVTSSSGANTGNINSVSYTA
jgi:hypothetical protein